MLTFRTKVPITERNMAELITQIFDRFMDAGIEKPVQLSPIFGMLIQDDITHTVPRELFVQAFEELCHGLRACLWGLGFKSIMQLDQGEFNYRFHSLRGSDIVVTYLSSTEY